MSNSGAGSSSSSGMPPPVHAKQVTVKHPESKHPKPTTKKSNKPQQADLDVVKEFQRCKEENIVRLDLSKSSITVIPPSVGQCTSLVELYLYSNKISYLPPEIGCLHALKSLALNENSLTSLPSTLANLKQLTVSRENDVFGILISLIIVCFAGNRLTSQQICRNSSSSLQIDLAYNTFPPF